MCYCIVLFSTEVGACPSKDSRLTCRRFLYLVGLRGHRRLPSVSCRAAMLYSRPRMTQSVLGECSSSSRNSDRALTSQHQAAPSFDKCAASRPQRTTRCRRASPPLGAGRSMFATALQARRSSPSPAGRSPSGPSSPPPPPPSEGPSASAALAAADSDAYFKFYSDIRIHDTMLRDSARTGAYARVRLSCCPSSSSTPLR